MIHRYNNRLALCHALKAALPDYSIVCGARHYSFIVVSRGESIRGSSGFDADGQPLSKYGGTSVWSRTPIGARYIQWDHAKGRDIIVVREHEQVPVHLRDVYATAERTLARIEPPIFWGTENWINDAVAMLKGAAETWLRPVADIEKQLRGNERVEIRCYDLDPLPEPKPKRKAVKP